MKTLRLAAVAAAILSLLGSMAAPAIAQTTANKAPTYKVPSGSSVAASGTVIIGKDSVTGLPCFSYETNCVSGLGGGGGGGGAITAAAGAYAAGAYAAGSIVAGAGLDGWDLTQGAKADAACAAYTVACSLISRIAALEKAVEDTTTAIPVYQGDSRPASGTITAADVATSVVTGQSSVALVTGTPTTSSFQTQAVNGMSSGGITVTGPFVGALNIEGSTDGGTTYAPVSGLLRGTATTVGTITAPAIVSLDTTSFTHIRVRASSYTSGTATVKMTFSPAAGMTKVLNPGLPGENHTGEVGGNQISVQVTPTTTAVAFTAGWAIGGLQTVAGAGRVTAGTGMLQSVEAFLKSNQTSANAAIDVFLFSDTTLSSTCTNAAAFVLSASDWAKLVGVVHLTDTTAGNTTTLVQSGNLAKPYNTAATTLYACPVVRGAPTWGTTTDLTLRFDFLRN